MNRSRGIAALIKRARKYQQLEKGQNIDDPLEIICLGSNVGISHKAIKHVVEQRGDQALEMLRAIPEILSNPTKIADNSSKRPGSLLYVKMNGKAKAVVLEKTKTPDDMHQVVSVFPMYKHTYRKLVDISGRPHVPSLNIA